MPLERALTEILTDCGAPVALTPFLESEGLSTCALFFDCVKDVDELEAKVAARLQPPATALRDLSAIRTVWRRAKVEAEKVLSGTVDAPEDWEIPLYHQACLNGQKLGGLWGCVSGTQNAL